jgi:hypothetical protein
MSLRILLRLALSLALLATSITTVSAEVATTDETDGRIAALIEKARAEGDVQVIVEVTEVSAQNAVLADLEGLNATLNVQYDLFPLLALTVGAEAIEALLASPWVVNIN